MIVHACRPVSATTTYQYISTYWKQPAQERIYRPNAYYATRIKLNPIWTTSACDMGLFKQRLGRNPGAMAYSKSVHQLNMIQPVVVCSWRCMNQTSSTSQLENLVSTPSNFLLSHSPGMASKKKHGNTRTQSRPKKHLKFALKHKDAESKPWKEKGKLPCQLFFHLHLTAQANPES